MKRTILLIIAALSFIILPGHYSWGQEPFKGLKVIPVPSSTKEVRKQKMQLMGSDFTTTIYASKLSFKQVADFYSKRLAKDSWQDLFSDKNIKKHVDSSVFPNQLIFKKGDEMITITYLPTSTLAGETRFSLSQGKISFPQEPEEQEPTVEAMEAIDIPVYPNAKPISFSSSGNKPLGYTTSDSAEEVLQFYRNKMSLYRWTLEEEMLPVQQEINPQDLEKIPQYGQLPPAAIERIKSLSIKMGHLVFKKGKKTCMVGVTEMSGPDFSENKSVISIVYSD